MNHEHEKQFDCWKFEISFTSMVEPDRTYKCSVNFSTLRRRYRAVSIRTEPE